jgi:hypothetical protein
MYGFQDSQQIRTTADAPVREALNAARPPRCSFCPKNGRTTDENRSNVIATDSTPCQRITKCQNYPDNMPSIRTDRTPSRLVLQVAEFQETIIKHENCVDSREMRCYKSIRNIRINNVRILNGED